MKACLEWSYELLSPQEQILFSGLSVFVDGFPVEDARKVCEIENAEDLFDTLRDASLVESAESINGTRCRTLQVVREFASMKASCAASRASSTVRTNLLNPRSISSP